MTHTPAPHPDHRPARSRPLAAWEHRLYPGEPVQARAVRADIAADLDGFDPDLVETVRLCVSELFTNCVKYTDSGLPGGDVLRALALTGPRTLYLGLSDWGGNGSLPRLPAGPATGDRVWAEGRRGLVLVESLSTSWGHRPLVPGTDLGTHVWAEFALAPEALPALAPYIFTRL